MNPRSLPFNFVLSPFRHFLMYILLIAGCVSIVFGVFYDVLIDGGDTRGTIILMDTSLSMSAMDMRSDIGALLSRIEATRELIYSLPMRPPFGYATFAEGARLQVPLTSHRDHLDDIVRITTPIRYGASTDIESALDALQLIYPDRMLNVIVFSDMEDTVLSETSRSTNTRKTPYKILFVGVGTTAGANILNNYDGSGRPVWKKYNGQDVISRLDTDNLSRLVRVYDAESTLYTSLTDSSRVQQDIVDFLVQHRNIDMQSWYILFGVLVLVSGLILPDYHKTRHV